MAVVLMIVLKAQLVLVVELLVENNQEVLLLVQEQRIQVAEAEVVQMLLVVLEVQE